MTKEIPDILYKYRDWNNKYHKSLLTEQEIYFASPSELNDPFDCAIPFRYDKEELTGDNIFLKYIEIIRYRHPNKTDPEIHSLAYEQQQKGLLFDDQHIEKQNEERKKRFNLEYGVLSLTENCNNFLMWSHYTLSHKGFCIGFNSEKLYNQASGTLGPVVYSKEFPKFGLFDEAEQHFIKYAFHKSDIWAYENEYRILKNISEGSRICKISNDVVEEIILGNKMPQKDRFEIIEIAKKNYPDARVYEVETNKEMFETYLNQIM